MRTVTHCGRWLGLLLLLAGLATTAHAQTRTVTLTLNMATVPDTTTTDSFIEVRGAVNGVAPITLADGNIIDWSDASTLEPTNIGGDYWQLQFQIADTTDLTFKFYSDQLQNNVGEGWESDPNPNIAPGADDATLPVHFFESQREYRGASGDRGDYDWRPYTAMEGSVAVWFRVAMFGEEAGIDGYNPAAEPPNQQIGVRGDNLDVNGDGSVLGPVDWGATKVVLQRESTVTGVPGYNVYSGVAYYPEALVGQTQAYKFVLDNDVLDDGTLGWEEGNVPAENRRFVVPAQDTTLHWVYYGDTPPSPNQPIQSAVIFTVDLSPLQEIGVFDAARGDTLEVRGDFNGWDCDNPDDCLLTRVPGSAEFEQAITITAVPGSERNYKFFLNLNDESFRSAFNIDVVPSGWEEPISTTGANRKFIFEGLEGTFQDTGVKRFNDVLPGNIMPGSASTDVTFSVDMTAALDAPEPFVPASDSVVIQIDDPIWLFTQGVPLPDGGGSARIPGFELTDPDGDLVYEGTLTVTGPTYAALQYKYGYGSGTFVFEEGGSTSGLGRRRTRFIAPNADGSFPATWVFEQETYQPSGNLPFEVNPVATGVEAIDDEVPSRIWLGQNYPNPFNPATTIEYSVDRTERVTLRVYDLLGRVVATLVDGVQPAATYRATFDASSLSSGVYFYRLETPTTALARRMLLIK